MYTFSKQVYIKLFTWYLRRRYKELWGGGINTSVVMRQRNPGYRPPPASLAPSQAALATAATPVSAAGTPPPFMITYL